MLNHSTALLPSNGYTKSPFFNFILVFSSVQKTPIDKCGEKRSHFAKVCKEECGWQTQLGESGGFIKLTDGLKSLGPPLDGPMPGRPICNGFPRSQECFQLILEASFWTSTQPLASSRNSVDYVTPTTSSSDITSSSF